MPTWRTDNIYDTPTAFLEFWLITETADGNRYVTGQHAGSQSQWLVGKLIDWDPRRSLVRTESSVCSLIGAPDAQGRATSQWVGWCVTSGTDVGVEVDMFNERNDGR